jgi:hypothetical protein
MLQVLENDKGMEIYPNETNKSICNSIRLIACWMLMGMVIVVMILCMSSCRTVKPPVEHVIKDSLVIHYIDSIRFTNKVNIVDSTRIKDSIVITKDCQGNITGKEEYHWNDHTHQSADSTAYYRDLLAKTIASHNEQQPIIVEVEKPMSRWQRIFLDIGKVASGIGIGLLIIGIIWLVLYLRKKLHIGKVASR